jgi:ABC-type sulfate transport system permease subunit
VQHIVGQLEVLTRTVSLFEERLSHTENKVSHFPLSSVIVLKKSVCLVVYNFLTIHADVENRESQEETKTKNSRSLIVPIDAKHHKL